MSQAPPFGVFTAQLGSWPGSSQLTRIRKELAAVCEPGSLSLTAQSMSTCHSIMWGEAWGDLPIKTLTGNLGYLLITILYKGKLY